MFDGQTALLIVDVQQALDSPRFAGRNHQDLVSQLERVLGAWRERGLPVYWVADDSTRADSPFHPDQPGNAFFPQLCPLDAEPVIRKSVSSGFVGSDLEQRLRAAGIAKLVVGGFQTNNCVEATVRVAGDLGFEVFVLADGCSTVGQTDRRGRRWKAEDVHQLALADMAGVGARVIEVDELIGALRDSAVGQAADGARLDLMLR